MIASVNVQPFFAALKKKKSLYAVSTEVFKRPNFFIALNYVIKTSDWIILNGGFFGDLIFCIVSVCSQDICSGNVIFLKIEWKSAGLVQSFQVMYSGLFENTKLTSGF